MIIDAAVEFIDLELNRGQKVLVHCNQGGSRSVIIGMLYLAHIGKFEGKDFYTAEEEYKNLYPAYNPAGGMYGFARLKWEEYCL